MKRFITYLYDYTGAVKGKNAGFVKVDMRGNQCRLEIHVRGLGQVTEQGIIYFIIEDSGLNGVKVGEIEILRGQGDYGTIIKCNPIGDSPYQFGQIAGVCVTYGDHQMAASKWKEDPNLQFALQDIHIWEPPQLEPEEELQKQEKLQPKADASAAQIKKETHSEPVAQQSEQSAQQSAQLRTDGAQTQIKQVETSKSAVPRSASLETKQSTASATQQSAASAAKQPTASAAQQSTASVTQQSAPKQALQQMQKEQQMLQQTAHPTAQAAAQETGWAKTWKQLQAQNEKLEFRKERNGDWIKMDIKAIRSLPKRNWYLGNNSFLVHGFFNYHYLILGREMDGDKERWYLGVPGFYQQQERVMATIFGFPEFFNSQNGAEPFGYWIHTVEME